MAVTVLGLSAACAVRSTPSAAGAAHIVVVDGEPVAADGGSLLDLLRTRPSLRGFFTQSASGPPLLVVDGTKSPGSLDKLAEINVRAVKRVTTFRSPEAHGRYGPDAINGAIVVETLERR